MTSVHAPLKPISNGSNSATFPAQLPPPLQMLPAKTKPSQAGTCLRCHGTLPTHSSKKWCEPCRQRQRDQMLPAKTKISQAGLCLRCHGALPTHSSKKWCEPCRQRQRDQMLPTKTKTSQAGSCLRCHGALPTHSSKKRCEPCRQRQREASKAVSQGHVARAKGASAFIPVLVNTGTPAKRVASPYVDADVTMADATTGEPSASASPSRSNPGATKRKADVMDSETAAERDQHTALHSTLRKEYQTGEDLFDGLARAVEISRASRTTSSSRPQYVNFHGSYTIVMDPGVRGEQRVKGVVDEFRLSGKLRFGNLVKRESEKSCGGHARTFWCACDPPPPPTPSATQDASPSTAPTSSQASARSKRTQRTIVGWLAKSQSKEELDDEAPPLPSPGCGGTITISAVTDFSHPLGRMGIEGQKMTVRVEHPGRDFKRVLEW